MLGECRYLDYTRLGMTLCGERCKERNGCRPHEGGEEVSLHGSVVERAATWAFWQKERLEKFGNRNSRAGTQMPVTTIACPNCALISHSETPLTYVNWKMLEADHAWPSCYIDLAPIMVAVHDYTASESISSSIQHIVESDSASCVGHE